jgi:hypothetical protein
LLGLIIACACFRLTQNGDHPVGVQIAPFLVAPAIIDCLTLMIRRARMGVSPFVGDRNHLHHLLLEAGLTATSVVVLVAAATVAIGLGAALALKMHVPPLAFSIAFLALWAAYFLLTRRREQSIRIFSRVFAPVLKLQARLGVAPVPLADIQGSPEPALKRVAIVDLAAPPATTWRDIDAVNPFGRQEAGVARVRGLHPAEQKRAGGGAPGVAP